MALIATLLSNPAALLRTRHALAGRHSVLVCEDWGALTRACAERPLQLVLFDLHERDGTPAFDRVRTLRRNAPRVALVAWSRADVTVLRDAFEAGRAGLDGLLLADVDDSPQRILALVEQAEARSIASHLRAALAQQPAVIRDAVLISVTRAHERLTPDGLARLLLLPRRVLSRRLEQAGFPPPHQLLTWGRLIVAAHLLEDTNRSADGVAAALEFASGSAFRNLCQRYLEATPQQIRANGGGQWVVERFLAWRKPEGAEELETQEA